MAIFTDENKIKTLREAGRRLAAVLDEVASGIRPGVTEKELDAAARRLIEEGGDTPAFLGYRPGGSEMPYPATLCVSVNDEVVHGIPTDRALADGDVLALDIGLRHNGVFVDMAKTYSVGKPEEKTKKLLHATEDALYEGMRAARAGAHVGDISATIKARVEKDGFGVVRELGGHGVGEKVHEEPFIPNVGKKGTGPVLAEGMVLALEPIVTAGSPEVRVARDGFTYKTRDGSVAAHFEHTILVTKNGAEIITQA